MRILFIPDTPEYGGAYNSFREMVSTLSDLYGVEPVILSANKGKYIEFANERGYENYIVKYSPFYLQKGNTPEIKVVKIILLPFFFLNYHFLFKKAVNAVENVLDFDTIDIIHTNVNRDDLGAELSRRNNVYHVWHLREPNEKGRYYSLRKNYIQYMNSSADTFISISEAVKKDWIKAGLSENKIITIYNGIDFGRFLQKKRRSVDSCEIKIIMVGRIARHKGQIILLKAIALLEDKIKNAIKVDFYGDPEAAYLKKLKRFVQKSGITNIVNFFKYNNSIERLLPLYDVGMMCSNYEGFGRVTVEYMLSGLCVIASNSGANPELIEDGATGLLFKNGDEVDLANKISSICNDKSLIDKLGSKAQEFAKDHFSKEQNAQHIYELYKCVLDDKRME